MNSIRKSIFIASTLVLGVIMFQLYACEVEKRALKADLIEISHIKYGMFNVDEWKVILAEIIEKKVQDFEVTPENRKEILKKTEAIVSKIIDEVESVVRQENKKQTFGFIKQGIMDLTNTFDDVREGIPQYAVVIVDRLNDPKTKESLKAYLSAKIDSFAGETVGEMDYSVMNEILDRRGCESKEECRVCLEESLFALNQQERLPIFMALLVILAQTLLVFIPKNVSTAELVCFGLSAISLLIGGILLPMIDIEATIQSFTFLLVGETVIFENQVLFFQSKSILEVVQILMQNGGAGLVIVSILVFSFSVLIPVLKMSLSIFAMVKREIPQNKFAKFIVLKAGKWSMADVLVVALFMAYIGFQGVINSQLTQLQRDSGTMELLTTNNSTLQLGFYLFTGYALMGLLVSSLIEKVGVKRTDGIS